MLNISVLRMKCPEGGCNYLSKLLCSIFYISKNFCTWNSIQVLRGSQTQYWLCLQCESSTLESKMFLWATRSNVGTGPNSFVVSLFHQYSCAFADSTGAYNSHSLALFTECQSSEALLGWGEKPLVFTKYQGVDSNKDAQTTGPEGSGRSLRRQVLFQAAFRDQQQQLH